ncbi:MAG: hypothetical protein HYT16_03200 [DPANN group archaeon]|nr:hypothetical protein [DPANN group archaeon]
MANVTVEQQIPNGLEVFLTAPMPLDEDLRVISEADGQLAAGQQVAQARLVAPRKSTLWQNGSWVLETLVYVPADYVRGESAPFALWTSGKHSPIPKYASEAVQAHRKGKEFYVPKTDFEAILAQARADANKPAAEREVLLDGRVDSFEVGVSKLTADQLMQFMFRSDVSAYARRLDEFKITSVPVYLAGAEYINSQKQPFALALWLLDAYGGSGLNGFRGLNYGGRARGVRRVAPIGAAPNLYEIVAREYGLSPETLRTLLDAASAVKKQ